MSNISCIWASHHSSSIASSSAGSGSGGSKTAKPPSRTSQFNNLWVESRTIQVIRARNCNLSLSMTAHPRVILRFPICNLLRTRDEYRRSGAPLESQGTKTRTCRLHQIRRQHALGRGSVRAQWETSLGMRTTDEQTYLTHKRKKSTMGRSGGSTPSSDWDSRGPGEAHVDFRRLTKTFRRIQHVTQVTKAKCRGLRLGQRPRTETHHAAAIA